MSGRAQLALLVALLGALTLFGSSLTLMAQGAANPTAAGNHSPNSLTPAGPLFNSNVELTGQLGGRSHTVFVSGSRAYVGLGTVLVILDVSSPANPVVLGQSDSLGDLVRKVVVAGDLAYVAAGFSGLVVIDVADPATPAVLDAYPTAGYARGLAVAGNYAYLAEGAVGLRIFDISSPADPVSVGLYGSVSLLTAISVAGNYAYVTDFGYGLQILDISNPALPALAGSLPTAGVPTDIAVDGGLAYVADQGLHIINVTNPAAPAAVSTLPTPGDGFGLDRFGSYILLADGLDGGLRVIDTTNPALPVEIGSHENIGIAWSAFVQGNYGYVATFDRGLRIFDLASPANPMPAGHFSAIGSAYYDIAVENDLAAVIDDYAGRLYLVDISDPTQPITTGFLKTPAGISLPLATDVDMAGGYAYVAANTSGLRVVDISDPTAPVEAGFYLPPAAPPGNVVRSVQVNGRYAYVSAHTGGLRIVDLLDPANPVEVGVYAPAGINAGELFVSGDYLYLSDPIGVVRIVNVSSPTNPVQIAQVAAPRPVADTYVAGHYLYFLTDEALHIEDIVDPANPTPVGSLDLSANGLGRSLAVSGGYAYINDLAGFVRVIDVANPAAAVEVGHFHAPDSIGGLYAQGNQLFVASRESGFLILEPTPPGGGQLVLQAPEVGWLGEAQSLTAVLHSFDYNGPVTYTWQATGWPGQINGGALYDQVSITWTLSGTKQVTITAVLSGGAAYTATGAIYILDPASLDNFRYMPVLQRP